MWRESQMYYPLHSCTRFCDMLTFAKGRTQVPPHPLRMRAGPFTMRLFHRPNALTILKDSSSALAVLEFIFNLGLSFWYFSYNNT